MDEPHLILTEGGHGSAQGGGFVLFKSITPSLVSALDFAAA